MAHGDPSNDEHSRVGETESVGPVDETEPTEPAETEDLQRQVQLRRALEFALAHSDAAGTSAAVLAALATLASDAHDWEAYDALSTGLAALVARRPRARKATRSWHA